MGKKISEMTPVQRTRSRALAKERQRKRRANLTGAKLAAYNARCNEHQRRYKLRKKGIPDKSGDESRRDPSPHASEDEVSAAEGGRQITCLLQVDSAEDDQLGSPASVRVRRRRRPQVEESHEDDEPRVLSRKRIRRQLEVDSGDRNMAGPPRARRHLVLPNQCSPTVPSAIRSLRDLFDSPEIPNDDREPGPPPRVQPPSSRAVQLRPSAPIPAAFVIECLVLCFFIIVCLLVTRRFDWSSSRPEGDVDASKKKTRVGSGSDVEMGPPIR